MNRCERVQNELKAYLDHQLDMTTRWRVQQHLKGCAACREELSEMEKISSELRADAPKSLASSLRARILQAATAQGPSPSTHAGIQTPQARSPRRRKPLVLWGATAAGLTAWFLLYPVWRSVNLGTRAGEQSEPHAPVAASMPAPHAMSNEKQIGLALSQYTQSYDEQYAGKSSLIAGGHRSYKVAGNLANGHVHRMVSSGGNAGVSEGMNGMTGGGGGDVSGRVAGAMPARQVHREAAIALTVDNVETRSEAIEQTAKDAGGFTVSSEVQTGADDDRMATLTLKVPVAQFQNTLNQIARQGKVRSKSVNGEDLTEQITAQQKSELHVQRSIRDTQEKLQQRMSRTRREETQDSLRDLRDTLNQEQAQLKTLHDQASLATLTVELHEKPAAVPVKPKTSGFLHEINDTLSDALHSMVAAAHLPILAFIWILAYSPLWMLLVLSYRWVIRK